MCRVTKRGGSHGEGNKGVGSPWPRIIPYKEEHAFPVTITLILK